MFFLILRKGSLEENQHKISPGTRTIMFIESDINVPQAVASVSCCLAVRAAGKHCIMNISIRKQTRKLSTQRVYVIYFI